MEGLPDNLQSNSQENKQSTVKDPQDDSDLKTQASQIIALEHGSSNGLKNLECDDFELQNQPQSAGEPEIVLERKDCTPTIKPPNEMQALSIPGHDETIQIPFGEIISKVIENIFHDKDGLILTKESDKFHEIKSISSIDIDKLFQIDPSTTHIFQENNGLLAKTDDSALSVIKNPLPDMNNPLLLPDNISGCRANHNILQVEDSTSVEENGTASRVCTGADNHILCITQSSLLNTNSVMPPKITINNADDNVLQINDATPAQEEEFYLRKSEIPDSYRDNKRIMIYDVSSTSGNSEKTGEIAYPILRNLLLGGSYRRDEFKFNEYSSFCAKSGEDKNNATFFPVMCDIQSDSTLKMIPKKIDNENAPVLRNMLFNQFNKELRSEIKPNQFKKLDKIEEAKFLSCNKERVSEHFVLSNSSRICSISKIRESSQTRLLKTPNDNMTRHRITSNAPNTVVTNTTTRSMNNETIEAITQQSDLIPPFAKDSFRRAMSTGGIFTLFQPQKVTKFAQRDQIVPSTHTNEMVQDKFNVDNLEVSEYLLEGSKDAREQIDCSLENLTTCKLNPNEIHNCLGEDYFTNDCDEMISSDLFPKFSVKYTKRIIEESFDFCAGFDVQSTSELPTKVVKSPVETFQIENTTYLNTSEIQPSTFKQCELDSASSNLSSNNNVIPVPEQSEIMFLEEPKVLDQHHRNDLFEISSSSWTDDEIRGNINVAQNVLDSIILNLEEKGAVEETLIGCNDDVIPSEKDDDELDKVIDDSIKKYENFTVDIGVLATPSTCDKYCQTEFTERNDNLAGCKRRLDFEQQFIEQEKRRKVDYELKSDFQLPSSSGGLYRNYSPQSMIYDKNIQVNTGKVTDVRGNLEVDGLQNFNNSGNQLSIGPSGSCQLFELARGDEVDEVNEEDSLYDEDETVRDQLNWSTESSVDWDQEVPVPLQCNRGPPPSSYITPKKPILRIGLSRSVRLKPLHRRL